MWFSLRNFHTEKLLRMQLERFRPIRTPYSPDAARESRAPRAGARGHPTRAARDGWRLHRRDTSVPRPRRADIRVGTSVRRRGAGEAARQRVSRVGGKRNGGISRGAIVTGRVRSAEGAMHGQGQKRRRRDEKAGSGAPKARCKGRVRSAEGAMNRQGQERRRRDARAGSEA